MSTRWLLHGFKLLASLKILDFRTVWGRALNPQTGSRIARIAFEGTTPLLGHFRQLLTGKWQAGERGAEFFLGVRRRLV